MPLAKDCMDLECSLEELSTLVKGEIEAERKHIIEFNKYTRPPWLPLVFILALFLINLPVFLTYDKYIPIWIISSFALIMVVWFLVMLPTSTKEAGGTGKRDKGKKENGKSKNGLSDLKENKKTLFNVLWNIFFTNCQPLAPGIVILQLMNIIPSPTVSHWPPAS